MKFLIIGLLAMTSVLTSCGSENPLSGKPRGVQEGNKPGSSKPVGDDEQALRVVTQSDDFDFVEENAGKYVIEGQIFIPGATFELRIENLTDFPGATFDKATGIFEWAPPAGFVDTVTDKKMKLNVLMFTNNQTPVRRKPKSITVNISSSRAAPEIVSISYDNNPLSRMREGESVDFSIVVRDATGVNMPEGRPTLILGVINANYPYDPEDAGIIGYRNTTPEQNPLDKSLWTYRMKVDLRNREITNSSKNISIEVSALSRFKVVSAEESIRLLVYSSLKQPSITWSGALQFKAGMKNSFTYSVFDPRGEGEVQHKLVTNCAMIHPNLKCGPCSTTNDPTVGTIQVCPITWDIPSDYLITGGRNSVTMDMDLSLKSKVFGDNYQGPVTRASRSILISPPDIVVSGGN